jgi:hypothetical protein
MREAVRPCTSATPPKADVNSPPWLLPLSATSGLMRCSKTAFLCGALRGFHNSRQPDREGGPATGLALDRDVATHHLAEAFTDREPEARAAVFASTMTPMGLFGKIIGHHGRIRIRTARRIGAAYRGRMPPRRDCARLPPQAESPGRCRRRPAPRSSSPIELQVHAAESSRLFLRPLRALPPHSRAEFWRDRQGSEKSAAEARC